MAGSILSPPASRNKLLSTTLLVKHSTAERKTLHAVFVLHNAEHTGIEDLQYSTKPGNQDRRDPCWRSMEKDPAPHIKVYVHCPRISSQRHNQLTRSAQGDFPCSHQNPGTAFEGSSAIIFWRIHMQQALVTSEKENLISYLTAEMVARDFFFSHSSRLAGRSWLQWPPGASGLEGCLQLVDCCYPRPRTYKFQTE